MRYESDFFTHAEFLKSCLDEKEFPRLFIQRDTPCPEVAVIGRSNAGKSSLLNHLTQKKGLVHVSKVPGKTQSINFFNIQNRLLLVDLPGYGFAKIDKNLKALWADRLSKYIENRDQLKLLILVLDMRRDLSDEDIQMIQWADFHKKKVLYLLSKSDKLSSSEKKAAEKKLQASIQSLISTEVNYLSYSIKDNQCRLFLKDFIFQLLHSS